MDQIDAIIRLKDCFKQLEEIDKDGVYKSISYTKGKIAEKMSNIAEVLDVGDFIPEEEI